MLSRFREKFSQLSSEIRKIHKGDAPTQDLILSALFAEGHTLLEGPPGTGKTLFIAGLAKTVGARFSRIQFTPDLMPSDILGVNIYNAKKQEFEFSEGPVFTDLLLADEVNRTPPKTQSALLEAMQEGRCTVDGVTREISKLFTVFATQNPIEYEGTYHLPEAQRDRFALKVILSYPGEAEEREILDRYNQGFRLHQEGLQNIEPVLTQEEVIASRDFLRKEIRIEAGIVQYVQNLLRATRNHPSISLGASSRAGIHLLSFAKVISAKEGRDYVLPDDVKFLLAPVLRHRLILTPEAEMEGRLPDDVIRDILQKTEVPR